MSKFSFKGITFEWHSILQDVLQNIWVMILCAIIGLLGSYTMVWSTYTPLYTSRATIVVNSKTGSSNSVALSGSNSVATAMTRVFEQPAIKDAACKYLKQDYFDGSVSASVPENTNILVLKVTSERPDEAYRLINAVLKVYPQVFEPVFGSIVIDVLKKPELPVVASNHPKNMDVYLISAASFVASFLVIVAISILKDTVKDEKSFKALVDGELFGSIPHERKSFFYSDIMGKRKRRKGLLLYTSSGFSLKFSESYHKIAAKIEYINKTKGSKIFTVCSVSENEGKTTVASNIAVSLASKGNKVLLIDMDLKKPALYKLFEVNSQANSELCDLLEGKIKTEDFLFRKYGKTSLYLALNTKTKKDHQKWVENGTVERIINELKEKVDYIIIDTAPLSVDASVTNIAQISEGTFLVVRTDTVHTSVINDAILTINEVGGHFCGCILNDVYPEFTMFSQTGFDESGYFGTSRYSSDKKFGKYAKYSGADKNRKSKYSKYSKYTKYSKYSKYLRYNNYSNLPSDDEKSDVGNVMLNSENGGDNS